MAEVRYSNEDFKEPPKRPKTEWEKLYEYDMGYEDNSWLDDKNREIDIIRAKQKEIKVEVKWEF